ncbi:MAG: polyprenyl synthetase family protein [Candidatus Magnetoovum sp. WYHC-5]|nr:polyprenyl synthetase family protein [Candidatus Magnetoovum sp. WYHC-5]
MKTLESRLDFTFSDKIISTMDINDIFKQYKEELNAVEAELNDVFTSNVVVIPLIGRHLLGGGGKRLRPLCLLLSAALAGFKGKERLTFAAIIEAIHTASLLHDDVVDEADVRRGKPTSHSIWGNQVVILVGDFLYANALRMAVAQKNQPIMDTISNAAMKMTEGEILQLRKVGDPEITEKEYLDIIAFKTGALFAAACRIGAILGNLSEEKVEAMTNYGFKTGLVFQMFDDILDFQADEDTLGKRLGKDLYEGKITLPLIYLLKMADEHECNEIVEIIKSSSDENDPNDIQPADIQKNMKKIMSYLKRYGAIAQAYKKAEEIVNDAKGHLSIFDESHEKSALMALADYSMQRKK